MSINLRRLTLLFALFLPASSLMLSCHRDPATRIQKAMERGDREFNEGKYPEAIIYYGQALQVDSNYAQAHYKLGQSQMKMGSFASAFRLFDCGPLHCSSAACHHLCCRLGVFFCSGNRQFPDLQVATHRGGDRAAVGEQLRFTLPAYRRVGRDIIRRPSAVSSP